MKMIRATGADNFGSGPLDTSGVLRWEVMARLLLERGLCHGAEIGVADGVFTQRLLEAVPGSTIIAVDPWRAVDHWQDWDVEWQHAQVVAISESHPGRVIIARTESTRAAATIEDGSLDWVFIDADHRYSAVAADIAAWTPKVREGGIVAGHDIKRQGVIKAVDESGPFAVAEDQVWWRVAS